MESIRFRDNFIKMEEEGPRNATTTNFYGSYYLSEKENYFDIKEFEKNLEMKIIKNEKNLLIIEIKNLNVSIANALRRIMISEVPTVAIEKVNVFQNTGIIADEILCHRIGLIPFEFDADLINYKEENEKHNYLNCFCFLLHVKYNKVGNENSLSVYSKDFKWFPINKQQQIKFGKNHPKVVDDNILITKLTSGQEIELVCFLEKGIGKIHAKWSPVSTAVYKMYPKFTFDTTDSFTKDEKYDLVNICPKKVFDIEDSENLVVKDPLNCSSCRVCIEKYPKKVSFHKIKNHFVFTIESTGCFSSADIFKKAILILKQKLLNIKESLEEEINA